MLVEEPYSLPMLNAVSVPEGVDEKAVRQRLRNEFKIEIGAVLGRPLERYGVSASWDTRQGRKTSPASFRQ